MSQMSASKGWHSFPNHDWAQVEPAKPFQQQESSGCVGVGICWVFRFGECVVILVMISPLSATTQNHRQALRMEPVTLIKQGTKPRMDMVQCKTTNMIEILTLDTEINVCVLPLSLSAIRSRAAWWERSQPACLVQAPNSSLIVNNNLKNVPINTSWSTFLNLLYFCLGKAFWKQTCLDNSISKQVFFLPLFVSSQIRSVKQRAPPALNLSDLRVHNRKEVGTGPLLDIWWGLRVDTRAVEKKKTGLLFNFHFHYVDLHTPKRNNSKSYHWKKKKQIENFLKVTPLRYSSVYGGDDNALPLKANFKAKLTFMFAWHYPVVCLMDCENTCGFQKQWYLLLAVAFSS